MLEQKIEKNKETMDKIGKIRPDFLFSYWILIWFIVYYLLDKTTKYGKLVNLYASPLIGLWIGFWYSIILFIHIILFNPVLSIFIKYSIMLFLIKLFPIYLLRNKQIDYFYDTIGLAVLFGIYNVYLYLNSTNVVEVYQNIDRAILANKNETPFFYLMDKIYRLMFTINQ